MGKHGRTSGGTIGGYGGEENSWIFLGKNNEKDIGGRDLTDNCE